MLYLLKFIPVPTIRLQKGVIAFCLVGDGILVVAQCNSPFTLNRGRQPLLMLMAQVRHDNQGLPLPLAAVAPQRRISGNKS